MKIKTLDEFTKSGKYLPKILRDFHDQKDLFKAVNLVLDNAKKDEDRSRYLEQLPNFVSAHIYVIDFFLWYMARRGYTLQKSRMKLDFAEYNPFKEVFDDWKNKFGDKVI